MFKSFKDLPLDELPENEDFRAHALQVTEAISLAVSTLDDLEALSGILKELGEAHSAHNLKDAHFDVSQIWPFGMLKFISTLAVSIPDG